MSNFTAGNQITLLKGGGEFFPALEMLIQSATKNVYVLTYIFAEDATGYLVAHALTQAAQRGVAVYLMLDGFGCHDLSEDFKHDLESAGVQLVMHRPKTIPRSFKLNQLHRMHRKIALIDNQIAFVGGINIIDDFNTPHQIPPRIDYAVKIAGPIIHDIQLSVQQLWFKLNNQVPIMDIQSTQQQSFIKAGEMLASFLVRDNHQHRRDIEDAYLSLIYSANQEIIIANAYFLPGIRFRHALCNAAARGVKVTILLQSKVEYVLLDIASHALYEHFLSQQIIIFEYYKSFMHSKVAVIDGQWAMVGSSNIDPFSLLLSYEANVLIHDASFAKTLRDDILQSINTGAREVKLADWQRQRLSKRFLAWIIYGLVRVITSLVKPANHH